MSKSLTQMCADVVAEKDRQISDLQSQLAESQKEIANIKGLVRERDKQIKNLKTNKKRVVEHKNKAKINFALEQLEKVKEFVSIQLFITTKGCGDLDEAEAKGCNELREETIKEIDNQINKLKEMK